jgi:acetoin utilization protein AcuB
MQTKHMPQLLAVMTPFPYQIEASESIEVALKLMEQHNIRHLPVIIEGNIETIVSDRDIKRAQLIGHRGSTSDEWSVGDISHPTAYFADVSDPLDQVLELMIKKQVEAIVVLKDGAAAGIFTDTDACKVLVELLKATFEPATTDDDAA